MPDHKTRMHPRMARSSPQLAGRLAVMAMAALLAGCVGSSDAYPSLAIRDVERQFDSPADGAIGALTPPPPPVLPSPALRARLETLRSEAEAAHRQFMREVPAARRAIARGRGASATSDSWGDAQVALASLESARSVTAVPLGDLDYLYGEAAADNGAIDAVAAVRQQVEAILAEEDIILNRLGGGLR